MAIGLNFKGFSVSGVSDPFVSNGHKFYSIMISDGEQDFKVSCGQDSSGEATVNSLVVFDKLYDGSLRCTNGKFSLGHIEESKLQAPVLGLSFSGLRVSSIPSYVSENAEGHKYYSANFSDGRQVFTMSLGSDDVGKKLRDSLVIRSVPYDGTIRYLDLRRNGEAFRLLCVTKIQAQKK